MSAAGRPYYADPLWLVTSECRFSSVATRKTEATRPRPLPEGAAERMRRAVCGELVVDLAREARGADMAENVQLRREIERLRRENARLSDELGERHVELQRLRDTSDDARLERLRRRTAQI
jgi:hypothetical protein